MHTIEYNAYRSVKSFNSRVRFLVMHYTAQNFTDSIRSLTESVSAHYLVPDPTDPTYIDAGFKDLRIFNLVSETERAWHAGVSTWGNRTNLNDSSIGIEIVNLATDDKGHFTFPPYNKEQIKAIKELALNILQRHPDISPTNVVGHSDIAPGRKSDPGASFPWFELYKSGVGAWYDEETRKKYRHMYCKLGLPDRNELLSLFATYGYSVANAGDEDGFRKLVRAFQLHFRPSDYSGDVDVETASILAALVEKYFNKSQRTAAAPEPALLA